MIGFAVMRSSPVLRAEDGGGRGPALWQREPAKAFFGMGTLVEDPKVSYDERRDPRFGKTGAGNQKTA
jgi:hypothetical protein